MARELGIVGRWRSQAGNARMTECTRCSAPFTRALRGPDSSRGFHSPVCDFLDSSRRRRSKRAQRCRKLDCIYLPSHSPASHCVPGSASTATISLRTEKRLNCNYLRLRLNRVQS
ncbi:hypothetical protein HBH69_225830 [Parastagonospora nodorum]|nr:hypothetical protein HBH69_225830 [Parastagonospora nodorum]